VNTAASSFSARHGLVIRQSLPNRQDRRFFGR